MSKYHINTQQDQKLSYRTGTGFKQLK